ncbi:MAG: LamG domain-containing protein, partial [Gammaproteobacteria bacterium]|nr:LamG domain-containing protein [Gammaproteobacteria bacterium]
MIKNSKNILYRVTTALIKLTWSLILSLIPATYIFAAQVCDTQTIGVDDLKGISGSSDGHIIGVGKSDGQAQIWGFDGANWTRNTDADIPDVDLEDVEVFSSTSAFAVGKRDGGNGTFLVYDNGDWTNESSAVTFDTDIKGVWALSDTEVYLAGKRNGSDAQFNRCINSGGWTCTDLLNNNNDNSNQDLEDVWGDSSNVYFLGKRGRLFIFDHTLSGNADPANAANWTEETACKDLAADSDFKDLWGDGAGNVYLTGKGKSSGNQATVWKYDGSTCSVMYETTTQDKMDGGIYGSTATGEIYAGGKAGLIIFSTDNGATWNEKTEGTQDIKDVWASSAGNAYYAGKGGETTVCTTDSEATVTTVATGGSAISADTSPAGTGAYTTLTGPVIDESNEGGLEVASYMLTAPTGFEFNTGATVNISIGGSGTGTDLTLGTTSIISSDITFNVVTLSTGTRLNTLTFSGIEVRPTTACQMATSGNIVFSTTGGTIITDSDAGILAEVAGTATNMYTVLPGQTTYDNTSCGTVSGTASDQAVNSAFNISQLVVTDQFGNIQLDYDNAGVTITYVYTGLGTPAFTSPASFTDGVATTTLTTTLDTADTGVTITADDGSLTGVASAAFDVTTVPPITGLIAEYQMEESNWDGTADEVIDSSGNDLHGVSINGPDTSNAIPAIAGDPGTCNYGVFDQIDDLASVADDNLLDIENSLTVTTWIYTFSHPGAGLKTILSKDTNYEFHLNTSGQIFWWWGGGVRSLTSTTVIPLNEWHHIAIIYDGDGAGSGVGTIYIDGVAEATTAQDNVGTLFTNTNPLELAADQAFAGRNFDGWIDEVRIYENVLSAAQVGVVMNETHPCTNPPTLPVLNADWHVDGPNWTGTGDVIPDFSGNVFNGLTNNASNVIGLVCNATDLSADSNTDYLVMDNNALDTLTDFSIAVWTKTANTGNQALLSGGTSTQENELIMWFPNNTTFQPFLNGNGGATIAISDLTAVNPDIAVADNTWHHLVWTRSGTQNCFYVDTNPMGCSTVAAGQMDIDTGRLIIGQEQDNTGGATFDL